MWSQMWTTQHSHRLMWSQMTYGALTARLQKRCMKVGLFLFMVHGQGECRCMERFVSMTTTILMSKSLCHLCSD